MVAFSMFYSLFFLVSCIYFESLLSSSFLSMILLYVLKCFFIVFIVHLCDVTLVRLSLVRGNLTTWLNLISKSVSITLPQLYCWICQWKKLKRGHYLIKLWHKLGGLLFCTTFTLYLWELLRVKHVRTLAVHWFASWQSFCYVTEVSELNLIDL